MAAKKNLTMLQRLNLRRAGRTLKAIASDLERQAKAPGKRKAKKSGKTYYESRANRSDLGRKKSKRI